MGEYMNLPKLKIGNLIAEVPIIQGGMAVRISTSRLAAAVANCGGIGIIGASGMSIDEMVSEIRKARELTKGIIGINIMVASNYFNEVVKAAIKEKIDLILAGAGISRDIFVMGKEAGVPIVPIVSTAKLAKLVEKLGASAVVVEGKEAGGHLGTDISVKDIVPEVKACVSIPVIAAGGIMNGQDIVEAFEYGADGVQMATRFVASDECNASDAFKQMYVDAEKEDVIVIDSPVGYPGRALRNSFTERIKGDGKIPPKKCESCLKHCSKKFCIIGALRNSQEGNIEEGLVFTGENVYKVKEVLPVKEIVNNLLNEVNEYLNKKGISLGGK